jgi:hypothetical protein
VVFLKLILRFPLLHILPESVAPTLAGLFERYLGFLNDSSIINNVSTLECVFSPAAPLHFMVRGLSVEVKSSDLSLGPDTDESYLLNVDPSSISTLCAPTVYGAIRGLETFSQMVVKVNGKLVVQPAFVEDQPRFQHRAVMIDTARLFRPVRQLEQIIDAMSWSKFNVLQLHFTDNGAWPVELLSYPNLTAVCQKNFGGVRFI